MSSLISQGNTMTNHCIQYKSKEFFPCALRRFGYMVLTLYFLLTICHSEVDVINIMPATFISQDITQYQSFARSMWELRSICKKISALRKSQTHEDSTGWKASQPLFHHISQHLNQNSSNQFWPYHHFLLSSFLVMRSPKVADLCKFSSPKLIFISLLTCLASLTVKSNWQG